MRLAPALLLPLLACTTRAISNDPPEVTAEDLAALAAEVQDLRGQVEDLQADQAAQATLVAQLLNQVDDVAANLGALDAQVDELGNDLEKLQQGGTGSGAADVGFTWTTGGYGGPLSVGVGDWGTLAETSLTLEEPAQVFVLCQAYTAAITSYLQVDLVGDVGSTSTGTYSFPNPGPNVLLWNFDLEAGTWEVSCLGLDEIDREGWSWAKLLALAIPASE